MSAFFQRNLYMNQGVDYTLTIVVETEDGTPIEGVTNPTFFLRSHYDSTKIYEFQVEFYESTFAVTSPKPYTETMEPGRYNYTMEYTDRAGIRMRLMDGLMTVRESMTNYGV